MSDNTSMDIRRYRSDDLEQIARLFYETVHAVNRRDYTARQLDVWATGEINHRAWDASLLDHLTYVATEGSLVIGFGDIDVTGYLDRLYVHKDFKAEEWRLRYATGWRVRRVPDVSLCMPRLQHGLFLKRGDIRPSSRKRSKDKESY